MQGMLRRCYAAPNSERSTSRHYSTEEKKGPLPAQLIFSADERRPQHGPQKNGKTTASTDHHRARTVQHKNACRRVLSCAGAQLAFARSRSRAVEIFRHLAEGFQDHCVIRRGRDCRFVRTLPLRHSSRYATSHPHADCGHRVGTLDRLARSQAAVLQTHEWQCHVIGHHCLEQLNSSGTSPNVLRIIASSKSWGPRP
jgi:hypothetical protein